jgi:hypothetical protein
MAAPSGLLTAAVDPASPVGCALQFGGQGYTYLEELR